MISSQPEPRPLALQVRAEPRHLGMLRDRLFAWLDAVGVPEELAERLVLSANEAATNVMAHAYRGREPGPLRMTAGWDGDEVTVTVADEGRWRTARPGEGLGGRGVLIMQESTERVRIDRAPEGTTVTLQASAHEVPAIPETSEPDGDRHRIDVSTVGETTVARLHGRVRRGASVHLRRQLLTATCGGVVPLVVDLGGLEAVGGGVVDALSDVAKAAAGAGERVVVIAPTDHATAELAELADAVHLVRDGDH